MMKRILLFLLLLFPIFSHCSEINGSVFLDNIPDHSGIIIKFNPVSPSAVYTEGVSETNGVYNITVINGIYDISFEKNGYQTYILNNQLVSIDTSLADVTLSSNTIVNVSGNVSGNWTNTNTYIVNGNIIIPTGETLSIEQGTEIKFDGYYSLIVQGTISAIGNEDNYIKFTSNSTSPTNKDWNEIKIDISSNPSQLKYCIIEYGKKDNDNNEGIVNIHGKLDIENCIVRHSEEIGISVGGNATGINILNNKISNCSYGITVGTDESAIIDGNKIFNIDLIGMSIGLNSHTTIVRNNQVSDCGFYGIQTWSDILIHNNILFNVGSGIETYSIIIVGGQPIISNNTIFDNAGGIGIYHNDFFNPNPIINSNIIVDNTNYGIRSEGDPMPSLVAYNLFYNNGMGTGNNLPVGVGTVVSTNNNGVDADSYFNIFSAPDLISINPADSDFCELSLGSDAINAGDPDIINNFNSTIIDIGAKESSETLSTSELSNNDFEIFPNPIINKIKIKARGNQLFDKIGLHNINGQIIKEFNSESPIKEYSLENLNHLESGIYIMNIYRNNKKIQQIKLLKK